MKVIQVGMGGMGNAWINTVMAHPHVEYAGFVEVNETIAAAQVQKYNLDGSKVFKSLDEALKVIKSDGVLDITPPQFHKSVSITALEAGIPVLSEKPLSNNFQQALEIVEAANRTGVLHMVTQNYRYHLPHQTLKSVLDSGEMGVVGAVHVEFFKGPHFGGFREEMAYPLIIDMSIHHFDLMRYLLGSDPVSVYGRSWNPPWSWYKGDASASVLLSFANGVTVSYDGSWCSQGRETPWNAHWRFECAKGVVALHDDKVYKQFTGQEAIAVPQVERPYVGHGYILNEFYEALTTGKQPATICQDNIKSLGIVFNVVKSFETGQTVQS